MGGIQQLLGGDRMLLEWLLQDRIQRMRFKDWSKTVVCLTDSTGDKRINLKELKT